MKNAFITILVICSVLLVVGCEQKVMCNKPYILVGSECCLDQNDKGICDIEEVKEEREEAVEETVEPLVEEVAGEIPKKITGRAVVEIKEEPDVGVKEGPQEEKEEPKETQIPEPETTKQQIEPQPTPPTDVIEPETDEYEVTRVIDGDTFVLGSEEKVRLICIDTPEVGEWYSSEATNYLKSLVLNKEVQLVKDVSETDRYGRLLRYVYVGDTFVNGKLVEKGYARVYRYPPDTELCDELEVLETKAKNNKLGIWSEIKEETTDSEYICNYNVYNCDDFTTHAQAQELYDSCGGVSNDIHQLDRDKDGLACESLP